jgi:glycosyltransferase involved in cell wall biosynthesis
MDLLIVSDAWHPQVNGVVRSLDRLGQELTEKGLEVSYLTPQSFKTIPCPTYPEIRLSLTLGHKVRRMIEEAQPACLHIATEGPLGFWARRYCLDRKLPFSTSYHTRFPEYVAARWPIPTGWTYSMLRWFHNAGHCCMVATPSLYRDLEERGFENLNYWSRGVDLELFKPERANGGLKGENPRYLYVGRVAIEKNIDAFLSLDLPGTKIVVGDGPQRAELEKAFPEVQFLGMKEGEELAEIYASCDVFVFPSKTDTFGIVLLEALASGLPVAAYPVMGPKDVIGDAPVGVLDDDLGKAVEGALKLDRDACRAYAAEFSWSASAEQFRQNMLPM